MFCISCGYRIAGAAFCSKCGTKAVAANAVPQVQAHPAPMMRDQKRSSVIGLCKALFALRLLDAIGWTILIIVQVSIGTDFWDITWNVVATLIGYGLAVQLFGLISANSFNSVRVKRVVESNMIIAAVGILFYGWQLFFAYGASILLLFIAMEIAILMMGALAYFTSRQGQMTDDK